MRSLLSIVCALLFSYGFFVLTQKKGISILLGIKKLSSFAVIDDCKVDS